MLSAVTRGAELFDDHTDRRAGGPDEPRETFGGNRKSVLLHAVHGADLASRTGKDTEEIIQEAVARLLDEDARFMEAVKVGEAAFEHGEYLTHEHTGRRLERLCLS
jgi:hypothetical protein